MQNLTRTRKMSLNALGKETDGMASEVAPPHAMMETQNYYSIIFNLFGVTRENIGVAVNESKHELTVMVRKERNRIRTGFFWTFALPGGVFASDFQMLYRSSAMEIRIPKAMAVA